MATSVLSINQPSALTMAMKHLTADDAIIAPTDTVYGVMCRFDRPKAIDKLYEIKGRPPEKAIPVLIGDPAQLWQVTHATLSPIAQALTAHFWPGPLTVVIPARSSLPAVLTAHQPTVGVRLPDHPWLCTLIRQSGPLAATSANLSGQPEAHTVAEILAQFNSRVELVVADAKLDQSDHTKVMPSTVVSVEADHSIRILRLGPIAKQVQQFLQEHFGLSC